MTDYISREAAINAMDALCDRVCIYSKPNRAIMCGACPLGHAFDTIEEQVPAADVRPVVLCRDCQNSYEWANVDGDNYRYCGYLRSRWNHDTDRMVNDDDFCKWGRKREES